MEIMMFNICDEQEEFNIGGATVLKVSSMKEK